MFDWEPLHTACMGVFGEPAVHAPKDRLEQAITGVFDEAYRELLPMGGALGQEPRVMVSAGAVNARKVVLGVQLSQFLIPPSQGDGIRMGPARGDRLFVIVDVQPDGHGAAKLILGKA